MSFASKHNKGGVIFEIDIKDFKFVTLEELFESPEFPDDIDFGIDGLFINTKSKYGDHPVAIVSSLHLLVDLPQHMNDEVKEILKDADDIQAIKDGKVGFHVETYVDKKFGRDCYGISWVDME